MSVLVCFQSPVLRNQKLKKLCLLNFVVLTKRTEAKCLSRFVSVISSNDDNNGTIIVNNKKIVKKSKINQ